MNKKLKQLKKHVLLRMSAISLLSLTLIFGAIVVALKNGEWLQGSLVAGVALIIFVGFAIYGYRQLKNIGKGLPAEDERSKRVMNLASAKSFYISIYWLLAIMWLSDSLVARGLDVSSTAGLGIAGMAVIFLLSWIYTNTKGNLDNC
ncbi:MAG: hypothetical protein HQ536_04570 [Parcubacteria group bacterium]|nr:hypothetical protein [Parcubacteria group bacterium]